eukprot:286652_1
MCLKRPTPQACFILRNYSLALTKRTIRFMQMKLGLAEYDLINGLELSESDLLTSICKLNTKQKAQTLVRHPMFDIKSDEVFAEFWRSRKDLRNSNSKEDLDCDTDNK